MTSNNTLCCDNCGRSIGHKSYYSFAGWILCGICYLKSGFTQPRSLPKEKDTFTLTIGGTTKTGGNE